MKMHRLALGTVQFGMKYGVSNQMGQVIPTEIEKTLQVATYHGIDTLDTAIGYQDSESNLGKNNTSSFDIITKMPSLPSSILNISEWYSMELNSSFKRLKKDKIYGLLLHKPEDLLGHHGKSIFHTLNNLKSTGKVEKIGISINSFSSLAEIIKKYNFDIIQAPFNILDTRLATTGILKHLKDEGYEIHTRSTFLQGLLLMNDLERPIKFNKWNKYWHKWFEWLESKSITPLEGSIQFSLSYPEIDKVIVGVQSSLQLLEIIKAVGRKKITQFPSITCNDENLITPSNWSKLG